MAAAVTASERLLLEMSADMKSFEKKLDQANKVSDRRLSAIEKRFDQSSKKIAKSAERGAADVRRALATISVVALGKTTADYADAWTLAGNKLAAAGVTAEDTRDKLVDLANDTRSGVEGTVDLYARLTRSTADLGATQAQVSRATEILNKAFKAGGEPIANQTAALLQLGQALGSGVLQGDELRSIRENSPILAKAIADEFGTTVAGLKKLGEEGKLTSDRVFKAILKGGKDIDAQFARTTPTIAESFQRLQNEAIRFVGHLDHATGASGKLANVVGFLADNIETLADVSIVAATVVGGVLAGQAIVGLAKNTAQAAAALGVTRAAIAATGGAAVASTAGVNALNAAVAFLGGPWGVVIAATAAYIGLLGYEASKAAKPTAELVKVTDKLSESLAAYETAAVAASVATGKDREAAEQAVKAKRELAEQARNAAYAQIHEARATLAAAEAKLQYARVSQQLNGDNPVAAGVLTKEGARAEQARANIDAAEAAVAKAEEILNAPIPGGLNSPAVVDEKSAKAAEALAKRQAEARVEVKARVDLQVAELSQMLDEVHALERQAELRQLIKEHQEGGATLAQATAKATADQARLDDARAEARALSANRAAAELDLSVANTLEEFKTARAIERKLELEDRIRTYQEQNYDLVTATAMATKDQLQIDKARAEVRARFVEDAQREHDLKIAELLGDRERVRLLERELAIRAAAKDLEDSGGLSPKDARAKATADRLQIEEATMRGQFRSAFRDGVGAAIQGDLAGYLESLGAQFADKVLGRSLDTLADAVFDMAQQLFPSLFDFSAQAAADATSASTMSAAITTAGTAAGATMGAALATAATGGAATLSTGVGTAITTSGAVAAQSMGAAIMAAGAQAAAAMASAISSANASSAVASLGGMRAAGGSVRTGRTYRFNEHRGLGTERFTPTTPGAVLTAGAVAGLSELGRLAKAGGLGRGGEISVSVHNATGVAADAKVEQDGKGGVRVTLEPLADKMIEGAGRSGKLRRSLMKSPGPRRRG